MEQSLYLRKDISAVALDDALFELERGIALVDILRDGLNSERFSREVYGYALFAAVEYLQHVHQHLKEQIYAGIPAAYGEGL